MVSKSKRHSLFSLALLFLRSVCFCISIIPNFASSHRCQSQLGSQIVQPGSGLGIFIYEPKMQIEVGSCVIYIVLLCRFDVHMPLKPAILSWDEATTPRYDTSFRVLLYYNQLLIHGIIYVKSFYSTFLQPSSPLEPD